MSDSATWKGLGDEGPDPSRPQLGRQGLRWFRSHLRKFVLNSPKLQQLKVGKSEMAAEVVAWYEEEYWHYLVWIPDETYRGSGYSSGGWNVDWTTVEADFARALSDVCASVSGTPPPALPSPVPLGPIDVEAALESLRLEAGTVPTEPRAFTLLLGNEVWNDACDRLHRVHNRIRRKTPRPCRVCGTSFVAGNLYSVTCDACKARKQKRCTSCQEVFTTPHGKAKWCDGCRAKGPAKPGGN